MSEMLFVLKSFIGAAFVVVLLQTKFAGETVEQKMEGYLKNSSVAVWIQSAAAGGALATKNLLQSTRAAIAGIGDGLSQGVREQRAGR